MSQSHDSVRDALQLELNKVSAGGIVSLNSNEYPGPFHIEKSLTVEGKGATLWALSGPLLTIKSGTKVHLKNLKVEVTGDVQAATAYKDCAIVVEPGADLKLENVEVHGAVFGLNEVGVWRYPKSLYLGQVASDREHSFTVRLVLAANCTISSEVTGVTVQPNKLSQGCHEVRLTLERLRHDVLLRGRILIDTGSLKRWMIIQAHAVQSPANQQQSPIAWQPDDWDVLTAAPVPAAPSQQLPPSPNPQPTQADLVPATVITPPSNTPSSNTPPTIVPPKPIVVPPTPIVPPKPIVVPPTPPQQTNSPSPTSSTSTVPPTPTQPVPPKPPGPPQPVVPPQPTIAPTAVVPPVPQPAPLQPPVPHTPVPQALAPKAERKRVSGSQIGNAFAPSSPLMPAPTTPSNSTTQPNASTSNASPASTSTQPTLPVPAPAPAPTTPTAPATVQAPAPSQGSGQAATVVEATPKPNPTKSKSISLGAAFRLPGSPPVTQPSQPSPPTQTSIPPVDNQQGTSPKTEPPSAPSNNAQSNNVPTSNAQAPLAPAVQPPVTPGTPSAGTSTMIAPPPPTDVNNNNNAAPNNSSNPIRGFKMKPISRIFDIKPKPDDSQGSSN